MAKTIDEQFDSMWSNLAEKTGRDRNAWIELARNSGLARHMDLVKWLKAEHGITHGYANQIALATLARQDAPPSIESDPIAELYMGTKAGVKPIHDALMEHINQFGSDVELAPKKGYVSLRRSKQFGMIQPASTRVDVGLILKGVEPAGRLESSGSFNAMFTHRIRVTSIHDVDAELIGWMRAAYEAA